MRRIFLILALSVVCLTPMVSLFGRNRVLTGDGDYVAIANSPTSGDSDITVSLEDHEEGDTQRRRKHNNPWQ